VTARRSPTLRRRRLGSELRRRREAADLTIEQVATALRFSDSKISRIENGQIGATPRDVRRMLEHYGVADDEQEGLVQVAREAQQRPWWQAYGDKDIVPLAGLEAEAARIDVYEASLVPGLLQTPRYAETVIGVLRPDFSPEQVERRVELRMARQSLLTRDDAPVFRAVLDEAILRRPVGDPEVMRQQLDHLVEAAALPAVTLQVIPFDAGAHPGIGGAFTIFEYSGPAEPDIVYLEHTTNDVYIESATETSVYREAFGRLCAAARPPEESKALVAELLASRR
jgi:transcriptional regulator with XRE-family HTH domain